jgi:hypothetical protein
MELKIKTNRTTREEAVSVSEVGSPSGEWIGEEGGGHSEERVQYHQRHEGGALHSHCGSKWQAGRWL